PARDAEDLRSARPGATAHGPRAARAPRPDEDHAAGGLRPRALRAHDRGGRARRRGAARRLHARGGRRPAPHSGGGLGAVGGQAADAVAHEATVPGEERERAAQTGHSPAGDAAALARDAAVRLLALTHVSTRYGGHEIRDEARAVFERTVVPRDFDSIEIPFP